MAKLILHFKDEREEYAIDGVVTIGRQTDNQIRLKEGKASRYHCRIVFADGQYQLEDLESANGTKINGRKISKHTLQNGNTIQIGKARIQFEADREEPEVPVSTVPAAATAVPASSGSSRRKRPSKPDDPLIGTELGGYRILARLGHGGMGTVYKAQQLSMDREVALKVLKKDLSKNRSFVSGFLREARMAGQLTHPRLVQVHDIGESEGILYFSMELIEGQTVNDLLKKQGKLPIPQALDIAIGVTEALEHAGRHNIVHQDIKPHNIMLDTRGNVKLADLGLATSAGNKKRTGAKDAPIMGTPHYMPPEQSLQTETDSRTDLYALGCTLFQMLTGRVPFEGPNGLVILTKHATEPRPDPRQLNVTIPDPLAELIMQMMAVEKNERPSSPKVVIECLQAIRSALGKKEADQAGRRKLGSGIVRKKAVLAKPEILAVPRNAPPPLPIIAPPPAPAVVRKASATPPASERRSASPDSAPVVRSAAPRAVGSRSMIVNYALPVAVVVVGVWFVSKSLGEAGPAPGQKKGNIAAVADPPQILPGPDLPLRNRTPENKGPLPGKKVETPADPAQADPAAIDEKALTEFEEALKARDRSLANSNFAAARKALSDFHRRFPSGPTGKRAVEELRETERVIQEALTQMLKDAKTAAEKRKYQEAAVHCTRLISADPGGRYSGEAKALMTSIDQQSEPRAKQYQEKAEAEVSQARLEKGIELLGQGLDELAGTRWGDPLSSQQFRYVLANKFLREMEASRRELDSKGKDVEVMVLDFTQNRAKGKLVAIRGLTLMASLGKAEFPFPLTKMSEPELQALVTSLGRDQDHLGYANLLMILKRDRLAASQLELAQQAPQQAEIAARIGGQLVKTRNVHSYDFSKWQDQGDWVASEGSWATKNDQYVLESTDGGSTSLNTESLGGPLKAENLALGFEFKPDQKHSGYFISLEFGNDRRNMTVLFNDEGATLQVNATEFVREKCPWKPKGPMDKVELKVKEDLVTLFLNGKEVQSLKAPGVSSLEGTVSFHIREAACTLDNIVIRRSP